MIGIVGQSGSGKTTLINLLMRLYDVTEGAITIDQVNIKDISLVTSGDYERFYYVGGVPYHHIIDPETLMPAAYFSSVSVFIADSGLADALSTALFCMSYEDGRALVDALGADAIGVQKDGNLHMTDGIPLVKE